jgi:YEATS domain-containing protein 4
LHPSFPEPVKTVEKFPFEIHQTGWGEFDIGIKIFFNDPAEKPVELVHSLKLYSELGAQPSTKRPVVSERYDEIVFSEPTEMFAMMLDRGPRKRDEESKGKLNWLKVFIINGKLFNQSC